MIDKEARAELRIALRRLVTGRMTNDQFDDLYFDRWMESQDRGVAQIGKFGYGLYSSDVGAYRLKGCYSVSPEERKFASRSILFLYTDQDFLWPSLGTDQFLTLLACLGRLGGLVAIALGLIAVPGLLMQDAFIIWYTLPSAVLLSVIWIATRYLERREFSERIMRMECFGDYDCWPFLHRKDLEKAKKVIQFFGPACSTAA